MTHEFTLSSSFFSFPVWHATRYRAESRVVTIQGGKLYIRSDAVAIYSLPPFELTKMSTQKELYYCYDFILDFTIKSEKILKCGEDEKVIYNKNEENFVINYNQQIEKLFIDSLSKEFSNHRIIAEETVFAMQKMPELTDAPTWFLDPIDGTDVLLKPWDVAAETLLIREAGGIVIDSKGTIT
ncbi:IMPA1 monophosphatase, partial [Acromyrmex insinuator]